MKRVRILLIVGAVAAVGISAPASAGNNNNTRTQDEIRRDQEALKKLNAAIDTARKSLDDARKKAGEAQKRMSEAKADVVKATTAARKEFETNPQLKQAIESAAAARKNYDAACEPVLLKLRDKSEYKAALAAKEAAVKQKDEGLAEPGCSDERRGKLISAVADAATAVSKVETEACAADSTCARLKAEMDSLTTAANKMRVELEGKLKDDPQVVAAKQKLGPLDKECDSAVAKFRGAEREYNGAVQRRDQEQWRQNEEERKRQDAIRQEEERKRQEAAKKNAKKK